MSVAEPTVASPGLGIEANGINVIDESERKGTPAQLFWPWCASNVSVLAVSYGSFVLGFGLSLAQALRGRGGRRGAVLPARRASSRSPASAGRRRRWCCRARRSGGSATPLPGAVSYLLLVGWETVLVSLATFATATVFGRLGWGDGNLTKVVAFLVVAAVIVAAGILGFDAIMRLQKWLTIAMIAVTARLHRADLSTTSTSTPPTALKAGGLSAVVGAHHPGDDRVRGRLGELRGRLLPLPAAHRLDRAASVFWPTFGGSLPVVILVSYGVLLCASDDKLSQAVALDPIGALTTILPTWFLVPFALVAIGGLVSGAVLDIYSSGLTLLTLGLRTPRWVAAAIDGVLMVLGTIYIVWVADSFLGVFMAFLIVLGVPMAAWCGIFLADLLLRRHDYDERKLFDRSAAGYGSVNVVSVVLMVVATLVGWGLVIDTTGAGKGLSWLGFLLGPLGLGGRDGAWAYANLGVPVALVLGFAGYLVLQPGAVRRQEASPVREPVHTA